MKGIFEMHPLRLKNHTPSMVIKKAMTGLLAILAGFQVLAQQNAHPGFASTGHTIRSYDSIVASRIPELPIPDFCHKRTLPPVVDNSANEYWPGIRSQGMFASCQQYSGVYSTFGYEFSRAKDRTSWNWENRFPAHYTWNFLNKGEGEGVSFFQSFDILKNQGQPSYDDYPYDSILRELGWISGYEKYFNGMSNRLSKVWAMTMGSEEGVMNLKNFLYDHLDGSSTGGVACFTTSSYYFESLPELPAGTPEAGTRVIVEWRAEPVHGLVIVGYNDSVRFDVNEDGQYTNTIDITGDGKVDMRDWEIGGFKFANSYGTWWSLLGYGYALYRSMAMQYEQGGIWNNRVYILEPDSAYRPLLTAKVKLDYNSRDKIRILAGVTADTMRQMPDKTIDFAIFNYQGGNYPMQGFDTVSGATQIEFGLDITPLLSYVNPGEPARFFLMVEEHDPDHIGFGEINEVAFINYTGGLATETSVMQTNLPIIDNGYTQVSAVSTCAFSTVQITTPSLPPFIPGQNYAVNMQAAGGRPPYAWTLLETYQRKPCDSVMPLISTPVTNFQGMFQPFAAVALPFHFPFYGKIYDTLYLNGYGFVAFEPQTLPCPYITQELSMLKKFPLIAAAFSQRYRYMQPAGDGIWFESGPDYATVRWKISVFEFEQASENNFAIRFYPDGRFEFLYGDIHNENFVFPVYCGVSKGDEKNFDLFPVWNFNDLSNSSFLYTPVDLPSSISLTEEGLLGIQEADSGIIYDLMFSVTDMQGITVTRDFQFSAGLSIVHQLVGTTNGFLQYGQPLQLTLSVTNNRGQPLQNLSVVSRAADSMLVFTDSLGLIPLLSPGQTVVLDDAFAFTLAHPLPDGFPVSIAIQASSNDRTWTKQIRLQAAAPNLEVMPPFVNDGYNHFLDRGEVADLVIPIRNLGNISATNLEITLASMDTLITLLSDPTQLISPFNPRDQLYFSYPVRASRKAIQGSLIPMQLVVTNHEDIGFTYDFLLPVGKKPVAIASLTSNTSSLAPMKSSLDSLGIPYDDYPALPFNYDGYDCIFILLGTAFLGDHIITEQEGYELAGYLYRGGKLYMEGYATWYYAHNTALHPLFQYETNKIPTYHFPRVTGIEETFTDGMEFNYANQNSLAVFDFLPNDSSYATLKNTDSPSHNLEIVYDGEDYKTIGTFVEFGLLADSTVPSTKQTLMKKYLGFFDINVTGPYPFFHASSVKTCPGESIGFIDDSFDNVISWQWEFQGGNPAVSAVQSPAVTYSNTGTYDVKLTVSDGVNTKSILKKRYITVNPCSGERDPYESACFSLFPNPAKEKIAITFNAIPEGDVTITINDLAGRTAWQKTVACRLFGSALLLDISALKPGIYFLSVQSAGIRETRKFVCN